jgi:iron-sulfur cluster insertion protein
MAEMMTNSPALPGTASFSVSERAQARIAQVLAKSPEGSFLRVAVNGGGCSGFSYAFLVENAPQDDDIVICDAPQKVVIDPVSEPFLAGAVLDYVVELIGSSFQIKNPNASSSCGCGISFSM